MKQLTQTDLTVRLQQATCMYGYLANEYSNSLKYGSDCSESQLYNLKLLMSLIDVIKCFKFPTPNVNALGNFNFIEFEGTSKFQLFINGIAISNELIINSEDNFLQQIVDDINSYQDHFIASINDSNYIIIEGNCSDNNLPLTVTSNPYVIENMSVIMSGGSCSVTPKNCFTNEEIQEFFCDIEKITGCKFAPVNYTYKPN